MAARALIEDRGYDVGLGEIGRAAGVSRQAVYLHFSSKAQLLTDLFSWVEEQEQLGALLAPVWSADTGEQAMERLVDAGAAFEPRILALNRAMLRAGDLHDTVHELYQGRMASRFRAMRDVVERIHADGRLAPNWDIDTAAAFVWALTAPPAFDMLVAQHGWTVDHWATSTKLLLRKALLTS
ncbi:MAG: TetR/AcrR family transcriptional regulator [Pseudonocardia sp.]